MSELEGLVLKNYNGYYYVQVAENVYTCKVKGKMKQNRFSLATGDMVLLEPGENGEGMIKQVLPRKLWYAAAEEASDLVKEDVEVDIQGYDIDGAMVKAARENARAAGVDHMIHFQQRPVSALSHPKKYGFLIMNPPYGERIEEKEALPALYREIGERFAALDSWSAYMITSYEDAEKYMGRKADKNRKIYNGMMKTYFYQFSGPRPPRRKNEG